MTLSTTQAQILGAAIVGLINGELTDETIAAVDTINRDDIPELLNNPVGLLDVLEDIIKQRRERLS